MTRALESNWHGLNLTLFSAMSTLVPCFHEEEKYACQIILEIKQSDT